MNTTGLDQDGAYSTAYDQMLILNYALQNPLFKEIYTTKEYTLTNGLKVEASVNKYNQVLNLDTFKNYLVVKRAILILLDFVCRLCFIMKIMK